jgi:ParB-like chromosome segregation protein Spo0J
VSRQDPAAQLELVAAEPLQTRRAQLVAADVCGHEHARPSRQLIESVARLGQLQPVVVDGSTRTRYRLIDGRRRVRAIELLAEEGDERAPGTIDAVIVSGGDRYGDPARAVIGLALHGVRTSSPVAELQAIEVILALGGDQGEVVKRITRETGMSAQTIRRRLKLRRLSPALRAAFERGAITGSVAEAAARLSAQQQADLEQALHGGRRVTLGAVRDLARARTSEASLELPGGLFTESTTPWRLTMRGHLQAALDAIPAEEQHGRIAEAIAAAQNETAPQHQAIDPDETATANEAADCDTEAERRLFEELERTEAFLYREGCGEGAVAVREAIRRLRETTRPGAGPGPLAEYVSPVRATDQRHAR